MMQLNVFNGRNNPTILLLSYKGEPLDLTPVNRMRFQIVGSTVELDSGITPELMAWNKDGQLMMMLGDLGVIGEREFKLIAYDLSRQEGQVILSSQINNIKCFFHEA